MFDLAPCATAFCAQMPPLLQICVYCLALANGSTSSTLHKKALEQQPQQSLEEHLCPGQCALRPSARKQTSFCIYACFADFLVSNIFADLQCMFALHCAEKDNKNVDFQ